jgi:hypothetical protein
MVVRLSALRTGCPHPQEDSWYSFLVEAESTPGARRISSIENCNELVGNRTRKLRKLTLRYSKVGICVEIPPLWSSGQSSWLQVQRSGLDSRRYHIFCEVVGLDRGPLSPVVYN